MTCLLFQIQSVPSETAIPFQEQDLPCTFEIGSCVRTGLKTSREPQAQGSCSPSRRMLPLSCYDTCSSSRGSRRDLSSSQALLMAERVVNVQDERFRQRKSSCGWAEQKGYESFGISKMTVQVAIGTLQTLFMGLLMRGEARNLAADLDP